VEFYKKKGKRPPCEQCFPGVSKANLDAWEIFKLVSFEQMGPTTEGILKVAELMEVEDPVEILYKVGRLISASQQS